MKTFTRIAGVIAMVAIPALTVSCSKNEASAGTNTESAAAPAAKSGDGLTGTLWEGTRGDGIQFKFTFAETDSMVLQQSSFGSDQGFYKVFGDTIMFTWNNGNRPVPKPCQISKKEL